MVLCCVVLCGVVVSPLFLFFSVLVCGCKERKEQKEKREREREIQTQTQTRKREREETLSSLLRNLFKDFLNSKVEVVNV